MKTVQFSQKFKRQVNKNINFLIKVIVGAFFSSKPRVSLVAFWLFLLSHIEEFFLPSLPYKRELKREEYHQGGRKNSSMWDSKKSQKATRDTLGLELKMPAQY